MESFALIIFGITGNLAALKLLPALYDLAKNDLLPHDFKIIGVGRKPFTKETFEAYVHEILHMSKKHHESGVDTIIAKNLCSKLHYVRGDFNEQKVYEEIKRLTNGHNRMFYLATYPALYPNIFEQLHKAKLTQFSVVGDQLSDYQISDSGSEKPRSDNPESENRPLKTDNLWPRVVIEKPLGNNLPSARSLDKLLLSHFTENQIYRLDHYLGKETLQNIINFRFGNSIFEDLMNKDYIDHIQITSAEDFGIAGRGGYYDTVGALKDVGQNHLLQMLALATMDSPNHFTNEDITRERIHVLSHLKPLPNSLVLGQYDGYNKEEFITQNSQTDTFFAFKTFLDNDRFKDVPIYIRGGKNLARTVSEIAVVFKSSSGTFVKDIEGGTEPNVLFYRVQPNEGIILKMMVKSPGHTHAVEPTYMQFCYKQLGKELPSPYERLLFDAMGGDQTFFNDAPEIEAQWKFIDPLDSARGKPFIYKPGTWGPKESNELLAKDKRSWIEPSVDFCRF